MHDSQNGTEGLPSRKDHQTEAARLLPRGLPQARQISNPLYLSFADMDNWTPLGGRFGLTENLAGYRCEIALAKQDKAK